MRDIVSKQKKFFEQLSSVMGIPVYVWDGESHSWTKDKRHYSNSQLLKEDKPITDIVRFNGREIVFDLDYVDWKRNKEEGDKIKEFLDTMEIPYLLQATGGKGMRFHIYLNKYSEMPQSRIFALYQILCKELKLNYKKFGESENKSIHKLIGAIGRQSPKEKYGGWSTILSDIPDKRPKTKEEDVIFPTEIKLWKVPDSLIEDAKVLEEENKKTQTSFEDVEIKLDDVTDCALLNYCINNKLPEGDRNNVISKNIVPYLWNKEDRDNLIKQYLNVQGINAGEIQGWVNKVGELKRNCGELINYQKKYLKDIDSLCKSCPKYKGFDKSKSMKEEFNNLLNGKPIEEFLKSFNEKTSMKELKHFFNLAIYVYDLIDISYHIDTIKMNIGKSFNKKNWETYVKNKKKKIEKEKKDLLKLKPSTHKDIIILEGFDLDGLLQKNINPAVGLIDEKTYYYGLELPYSKKIKRGDFEEMVGTTELGFIAENNLYNSEEFENKFNSKITGSLNTDHLRWDLQHIKNYINKENISLTSKEIFDKIKKQYKKYVDFVHPEEYSLFTIWDMGTYLFSLFDSYPYIHLFGLRNTGKSKVMGISHLISFNSELLSSMSMATLFRITEQNRPTLHIDEFELKSKETREDKEFESLLNNGYKRGVTVPRAERESGDDGKWIIKRFQVFCPKMIGNISGLKGALPSRCIKTTMRRALVNDPRGKLMPNLNDDIWQEIKNNLYIWGLTNWKEIRKEYYSFKEIEGLSNRALELWKPLLTISKIIGKEEHKEMVEFAKTKSKEFIEEEEKIDSWESLLLETLHAISIPETGSYIQIKTIHEKLIEDYFIERHDTYGTGEYTRVVPKYVEPHPGTKWVSSALRKMGVTNFIRRKEGIHVFLTRYVVDELIQRLQSTQTKKDDNPSELENTS